MNIRRPFWQRSESIVKLGLRPRQNPEIIPAQMFIEEARIENRSDRNKINSVIFMACQRSGLSHDPRNNAQPDYRYQRINPQSTGTKHQINKRDEYPASSPTDSRWN